MTETEFRLRLLARAGIRLDGISSDVAVEVAREAGLKFDSEPKNEIKDPYRGTAFCKNLNKWYINTSGGEEIEIASGMPDRYESPFLAYYVIRGDKRAHLICRT